MLTVREAVAAAALFLSASCENLASGQGQYVLSPDRVETVSNNTLTVPTASPARDAYPNEFNSLVAVLPTIRCTVGSGYQV